MEIITLSFIVTLPFLGPLVRRLLFSGNLTPILNIKALYSDKITDQKNNLFGHSVRVMVFGFVPIKEGMGIEFPIGKMFIF